MRVPVVASVEKNSVRNSWPSIKIGILDIEFIKQWRTAVVGGILTEFRFCQSIYRHLDVGLVASTRTPTS